MLIRIYSATGWRIPEDNSLMTSLVIEFGHFLIEQCGDLNPEEIALAFRTYALEIKDWGKSMNLSLILQPINRYRSARHDASVREERLKTASKDAMYAALPVGETDWSDEWERVKDAARNGQIRSVRIITPLYDWLNRKGMITFSPAEKRDIMEECRQIYALEMKVALQTTTIPVPAAREKYELLIKEGKEWLKSDDLCSVVLTASKIETVRREAVKAIQNEKTQ
ncbi:hypothetical protein ACE38W_14775 [Chitinophaga sp. Hz27]|uniref:hypothetical protein n=1 Tax=Chitinophaga sp. Hz27 TaxID=3347169 RepID=UPI0035E38210